ncbi:MAG: PmoA family protein [Armatimonadetes bacterium]|nr:PmoA family protein [Armatimonadota bacterium]
MCGCGCDRLIYEVSAGPHERRDAIVAVPCAVNGCTCACSHVHTVYELDEKGDRVRRVPSQCVRHDDGWRLHFVVPYLAAGETRRFEVDDEPAEEQRGVGVLLIEGQQVDFKIGDELFTSYVIKPDIARPYCYPVYGPGGLEVTNFAPSDHVHHKSMYVAQGAVNGHDNWSEMSGHARTVNLSVDVLAAGPLIGAIQATNDWVSANGEKLMQEITRILVYNLGSDYRIMDWTITWCAAYQGVHIGDTKEAGTLSVRVAESMEERNGGRIVNAYGAMTEAECWGKRAPWVDYYGPVGDETLGIAIFDHPANFRHPTYWHVRSYGLFTANQWGIHDFTGDWSKRGDYVMPKGWSLTFDFRVYIHRGDTVAADVAGKYLDYAYPPKVRPVH